MTRRSAALVVLAITGLLAVACGTTGPPTQTAAVGSDFMDVPGLGRTRVDVPRPSGVASAACDDDPLPPSSDETTAERVAALRAAGLFADRDGVSDADLAAEIDQKTQALWGGALPPDDPMRDLAVAEQDAARVLWIDLEADVAGGNEVYVATIEQLEGVAVGVFEPAGVGETWAAEEGPVRWASVWLRAPRAPAGLSRGLDRPGHPRRHQRAHRRQRPALRAVPRLRPVGRSCSPSPTPSDRP